MIKQDEHILYVSNAKIVQKYKEDGSMVTGFVNKKIILTNKRGLIFESIQNQTQDTEYEVITNKSNTKAQKNLNSKQSYISVNWLPQFEFDITLYTTKIIVDQDPSCLNYFQMIGIKSLVKTVVGTVMLKNIKKRNFKIILFKNIKNGYRFCKALTCSKAWLQYQINCSSLNTSCNYLWIRLLLEAINSQNSIILIDPNLFQTGSQIQRNLFTNLVTDISFIHTFQHRYLINTSESAEYAIQFIETCQKQTYSIIMSDAKLTSQIFGRMVTPNLKLTHLIHLDLQNNLLNNQIFLALHDLIRSSKNICNVNLAYNQLTLTQINNFTEFLKSIRNALTLNLINNLISDDAIPSIQKLILYSINPPIKQIDFSNNKFSKKGVWRIYVGNVKTFKNHSYMNFIIYPLPMKQEIFEETQIDFARPSKQINFNLHSVLIQQLQEQSFLRNTFHENMNQTTLTLKISRDMKPGVKLCQSRQDVSKILKISDKIENFIYNDQTVENYYNITMEIKEFPFQISPRSLSHFLEFLHKKLNQALFIRDHYALKYILKSMKQLDVLTDIYTQRLKKVAFRNQVFIKRVENIFNFEIDETVINKQLNFMCKQGLRLYLEGQGVDILYYLKHMRDQFIERMFLERYNPQHQLFQHMSKVNITADERVTIKNFIVPFEIKIEKSINQNFYLHPWQTNYVTLVNMNRKTLDECMDFLQNSQKKDKFIAYFERIEERVQFIKNQFTLFTYKKFKVSYLDPKVNACRLLYLYKNIIDTDAYFQIPIELQKKTVTNEKIIEFINRQKFCKLFHITNYPNLNPNVLLSQFYNFKGIITNYQQDKFKEEAKKTLVHLHLIFAKMQKLIWNKASFHDIVVGIIQIFHKLILVVRELQYPEQVKEEIYLNIMAWRSGRYGNNTQLMRMLPVFTMYLKPPIVIEKFLVASIFSNDFMQTFNTPLCVAFNPNNPVSNEVFEDEDNFVQRDWIPPDSILTQLVQNQGKVALTIQLLTKKTIRITVPQVKTVSQLMRDLVKVSEMSIEDRENFWLYHQQIETKKIIAFQCHECVGQIFSNFDFQKSILLLKRRVYCPEIKYTFAQQNQQIINSLYGQIKLDYLYKIFYSNDEQIFDVASIMFVVDCIEKYQIQEAKRQKSRKQNVEPVNFDTIIMQELNALDQNMRFYLPREAFQRIMKTKQDTLKQLRARISQRLLKRQQFNPIQLKVKLMEIFKKYPQFCSSNYVCSNLTMKQVKISINCMSIMFETLDQKQKIYLQKLIMIIPKNRYLMIYYHKHENSLGKMQIQCTNKQSRAISMDILSYCTMRIKMASNNLYELYRHEKLIDVIYETQKTLKKVYNSKLEQDLNKQKKDLERIKKLIGKFKLTLNQFSDLIHSNPCNYVKSEKDRKLYTHRNDKRLSFRPINQYVAQQTLEQINYKIFNVLFPQAVHQYNPSKPSNSKLISPCKNSQMNQLQEDYEKLETFNKFQSLRESPLKGTKTAIKLQKMNQKIIEEDDRRKNTELKMQTQFQKVSSEQFESIVASKKSREKPQPRRRNR